MIFVNYPDNGLNDKRAFVMSFVLRFNSGNCTTWLTKRNKSSQMGNEWSIHIHLFLTGVAQLLKVVMKLNTESWASRSKSDYNQLHYLSHFNVLCGINCVYRSTSETLLKGIIILSATHFLRHKLIKVLGSTLGWIIQLCGHLPRPCFFALDPCT